MKKITVLLLSVFFIFSCSKNKGMISLNEDDSLAMNPTIQWAVVIEPFAAFRKEASWSSAVSDHCRFGDVLMIEGNAILDSSNESASKEIWYRFDKGWLSSSSVTVYQNKYKAQKASSDLMK
ncbi:MAG: hypothetical protein J6Y36_04740 [Treponema sp.]|uniref:hypothetical protein n=1 Tax=Treponema sp. TaxID=166 RepID=UPI001B673ACA|nr:hypothetical protein [Treponema sp.]MBP5402448.1 hypothetical protein [Treponema sp.]MBR5933285.1 hypothetical protein [Treponema sp.]